MAPFPDHAIHLDLTNDDNDPSPSTALQALRRSTGNKPNNQTFNSSHQSPPAQQLGSLRLEASVTVIRQTAGGSSQTYLSVGGASAHNMALSRQGGVSFGPQDPTEKREVTARAAEGRQQQQEPSRSSSSKRGPSGPRAGYETQDGGKKNESGSRRSMGGSGRVFEHAMTGATAAAATKKVAGPRPALERQKLPNFHKAKEKETAKPHHVQPMAPRPPLPSSGPTASSSRFVERRGAFEDPQSGLHRLEPYALGVKGAAGTSQPPPPGPIRPPSNDHNPSSVSKGKQRAVDQDDNGEDGHERRRARPQAAILEISDDGDESDTGNLNDVDAEDDIETFSDPDDTGSSRRQKGKRGLKRQRSEKVVQEEQYSKKTTTTNRTLNDAEMERRLADISSDADPMALIEEQPRRSNRGFSSGGVGGGEAGSRERLRKEKSPSVVVEDGRVERLIQHYDASGQSRDRGIGTTVSGMKPKTVPKAPPEVRRVSATDDYSKLPTTSKPANAPVSNSIGTSASTVSKPNSITRIQIHPYRLDYDVFPTIMENKSFFLTFTQGSNRKADKITVSFKTSRSAQHDDIAEIRVIDVDRFVAPFLDDNALEQDKSSPYVELHLKKDSSSATNCIKMLRDKCSGTGSGNFSEVFFAFDNGSNNRADAIASFHEAVNAWRKFGVKYSTKAAPGYQTSLEGFHSSLAQAVGARSDAKERNDQRKTRSVDPRQKDLRDHFSGTSAPAPTRSFYSRETGIAPQPARRAVDPDTEGSGVCRRSSRLATEEEEIPRLLKDTTSPDTVVLVYPFNAPGAVSVTHGDTKRLKEGEFLNDTLIEYGMKKIYNDSLGGSNKTQKEQVHMFNSFFYKKLSAPKRKDVVHPYESVHKWTLKAELFKKDYIIVPINEHLHWYLAIIVNPKAILVAPKLPSPAHTAKAVIAPRRSTRRSMQGDDGADGGTEAERDDFADEEVEETMPTGFAAAVQATSQGGEESEDMDVDDLGEANELADVGPVIAVADSCGGLETAENSMDVDLSTEQLAPASESRPPRVSSPELCEPLEAEVSTAALEAPFDGRASVASRSADIADSASDDDKDDREVHVALTAITSPSATQSNLPVDDATPQKPNTIRPVSFGPSTAPPVSKTQPARSPTPDVTKKSYGDASSDVEVEEERRDPSKCYIFTFDSLGSTHKPAIKRLTDYLGREARRKETLEETSEWENVVGRAVEVPQQDNYCDCGLYLLHYVETFLSDPDKFIRLILNYRAPPSKKKGDTTLSKNDQDWGAQAAATRREVMRKEVETAKVEWAPLAIETAAREKKEKEERRATRAREKQEAEEANNPPSLKARGDSNGVDGPASKAPTPPPREITPPPPEVEKRGKGARGRKSRPSEVIVIDSDEDDSPQRQAPAAATSARLRPSSPSADRVAKTAAPRKSNNPVVMPIKVGNRKAAQTATAQQPATEGKTSKHFGSAAPSHASGSASRSAITPSTFITTRSPDDSEAEGSDRPSSKRQKLTDVITASTSSKPASRDSRSSVLELPQRLHDAPSPAATASPNGGMHTRWPKDTTQPITDHSNGNGDSGGKQRNRSRSPHKENDNFDLEDAEEAKAAARLRSQRESSKFADDPDDGDVDMPPSAQPPQRMFTFPVAGLEPASTSTQSSAVSLPSTDPYDHPLSQEMAQDGLPSGVKQRQQERSKSRSSSLSSAAATPEAEEKTVIRASAAAMTRSPDQKRATRQQATSSSKSNLTAPSKLAAAAVVGEGSGSTRPSSRASGRRSTNSRSTAHGEEESGSMEMLVLEDE